MKGLKHNALVCLDCFTVLTSFWRHHFVKCPCTNGAFVDGGFDYFRFGAANLKRVKHVYLIDVGGRVKVKKKGKKK